MYFGEVLLSSNRLTRTLGFTNLQSNRIVGQPIKFVRKLSCGIFSRVPGTIKYGETNVSKSSYNPRPFVRN